jgi:hypothetical protein
MKLHLVKTKCCVVGIILFVVFIHCYSINSILFVDMLGMDGVWGIGILLAGGGACVISNNIRVLALYGYQSNLIQYYGTQTQPPPHIIKDMERSRRLVSLRATWYSSTMMLHCL